MRLDSADVRSSSKPIEKKSGRGWPDGHWVLGPEAEPWNRAEAVTCTVAAPRGRPGRGRAAPRYCITYSSIRLWDAETFHPIGPALPHDRMVLRVAFTPDGERLTSVSEGGEVQTWTIPDPPDAPPDRLALRLEVETGLGFSESGDDVGLLKPGVWEARRRALAALEPPGDVIVPSAADLDWHEATARFAERRGKWFTARFHLDRLIAGRPDDGMLRLRRAWVNALDGRLDQAEVDLSAALERGPRDACIDLLVHYALEAREAGKSDPSRWTLDRAARERPDGPSIRAAGGSSAIESP